MAKLIFKSTEELVEFIPIPVSTDFKQLRPEIETAQREYLFDLFGAAFCSDLIDKLEGTNGPSDLEQELIDRMRYVVAQMTMYNSTDLINIEVTSGGFTVNNSEGKSVASSNRVLLFKEQLYKNAQKGVNELFLFLESKADDFTDWKDGDERKAFKQYVVSTPKRFNQCLLGINVGYFIFSKMLPTMEILEERYFTEILGKNLFNHIKTKLRNSEALGDYAPILPLMQRAIAPMVLAETFDSLKLEMDGTAAFISSIKNANEPQQRSATSALDEERVVAKHREYASKAFQDLAKHLLDNADDYQLFNESTAFSDRTGTAPILPDGDTAAFYAL